MLRYIGRRVLQMIPVFFGATLLIYALVFLMPGDPVEALGGDRGLTEAARARIEAEYNLDKPFIVQYLLYIKGIFMLDFGTTFSGVPVTQVMANAFPRHGEADAHGHRLRDGLRHSLRRHRRHAPRRFL